MTMIVPDPLFKGCTRPAMVAGVPIVPFGLLIAICVLMVLYLMPVFGLIAALVSAIFGGLTFAVMRLIVHDDDQKFRLLGLRLVFRFPLVDRTFKHFGHSVYMPVSFRKRKGL